MKICINKKNTQNKNRNIIKAKKILLLIILFAIYIYISAYSYVKTVSTGLSNNVFRLHIIANSNSVEDQNLKYIIRDNLIKYMNTLCKSCSSKEDVIYIAKNHLQDFKNITENIIKENGYSYQAQVEIGNFEFPTKNYGDISLPSGYYDALKVKIGQSSGENWWCVMFPPLCFINTSTGIVSTESKHILKQNLSNEEYLIISNSNKNEYNFKFKIIEFFEFAGLITAKND